MARRATYVVDRRFLDHFFWKVEGTVRIHISHVQLPYTVINVHGNIQGGGGGEPNIGKLCVFQKSSNCNKGGREHLQPYWIFYGSHLELLKMATNQNRKFDLLGTFWGVLLIAGGGKLQNIEDSSLVDLGY